MLQDSDDDRNSFGGPPSVGASSNSSRPASALDEQVSSAFPRPALSPRSPGRPRGDKNTLNQDVDNDIQDRDDGIPDGGAVDQTTLLPNDEEGFALAPVDTTAVKGMLL